MDSDTAVFDPALHPKYVNGEKLEAKITELCGYLYAGTYRLLVMIREFDELGYRELPGLHSCAHWLNFKCGIGMNAAREKVRVARALAGLPKISAAFSRGELSYSRVRAMTRVANADNEDYLLMIARHYAEIGAGMQRRRFRGNVSARPGRDCRCSSISAAVRRPR